MHIVIRRLVVSAAAAWTAMAAIGCETEQDARVPPTTQALTRSKPALLDRLRPGERPLPHGFVATAGSLVHDSGWPTVIYGERDHAVMVFVPAGTFQCGLTEKQMETLKALCQETGDSMAPIKSVLWDYVRKSRDVTLPAFYIDKYEVTNLQYHKFLSEQADDTHRPGILATGAQTPAGGGRAKIAYDPWRDPSRNGDSQPVTCVSSSDALAYAKWAKKRLPTHDEWTRAAVGDGKRIFPWGDHIRKGVCRFKASSIFVVDAIARAKPMLNEPRWCPCPYPVGSFDTDVSPFGCYDMGGNVSEYVWKGRVSVSPVIAVGGDAGHGWLEDLTPAMKQSKADHKLTGFRLVLDLP